MSQTQFQAVPGRTKRTRGIIPALLPMLVSVALAVALPALWASDTADSTLADSSATADSAAAASLAADSTAQAGAADSVIQRLNLSRPGAQSGRDLDLTFDKPAAIFSAKNISMVLIVIGLLVLFLHFLRKFLYKPIGGTIAGGQFQVIRQFHLGPKKSVAMVRFAGRLLLLGVTDSNINTLAEIDDPEEVEKIIAENDRTGDTPVGAFKDIYHNLLSRSGRSVKK